MLLPPPETTDAVARVYKSSQAAQGFVMNLVSAWASRPDVFESFAALRGQLTASASLSKRDQAVLVCAAASQLQDSYCSLAWGKTLAAQAGAAPAAAVLSGSDHAALTARDRALAAWARKVVSDPNSAGPSDITALRGAGLDDRAIFEVTAFIAFRLAFSTVNDALGAIPDWQVADAAPPEVRSAVTYGRPPQTAPAEARPQ
ncbi:carboxymuconolactone decarboxylase family protein [Rivibacter subsaxonicus]|uniref:Putative peroxidase-related enzyme n=1 Tax=Rivibacter subsaxonicus TaxID=457575 RepID=A0A4Q7W087_9BURK|nr:hypothetical protein [Rivibacter subsaxonicus]RZU02215.1 putative peroxidase-related enzyme [Rivibacter subsaxonicus]